MNTPPDRTKMAGIMLAALLANPKVDPEDVQHNAIVVMRNVDAIIAELEATAPKGETMPQFFTNETLVELHDGRQLWSLMDDYMKSKTIKETNDAYEALVAFYSKSKSSTSVRG